MKQVHTKYTDTLSFADIVKIARKFDFSSLLSEYGKSFKSKPRLCRWIMDGEEHAPRYLTTGMLYKIKDPSSLVFVFSIGNKEEALTVSDFDIIKTHI